MKLTDILLILLQFVCIYLAYYTQNLWLLTGIPVFIFLLFISLRASIKQRGVDIQNKMEDLSGGKLWSLNVNSVCSICDSPFEYEFDLGTRVVECPHCNKKNKLVVDITPIPNQDI